MAASTTSDTRRAAAPILRAHLNDGVAEIGGAAPEVVQSFADPARLSALGAAPLGGGALLLTPAPEGWSLILALDPVAGDAVGDAAFSVRGIAVDADAFADAGPAIVAAALDLLEASRGGEIALRGPGRGSAWDAARAAAAAALESLDDGAPPEQTPLWSEDSLAFFRALSVALERTPPDGRWALSASYGLAAPMDGVLFAAAADGSRPAFDPSAEPVSPQSAPAFDASDDPMDAAPSLASFRAAWAEELGVEPEPVALAMDAFLFDRGAQPPEPDPTAPPRMRAAALSRAVDALETGSVGGRTPPKFGRARAAGVVAIETSSDSKAVWDVIRAGAPSRAYWMALAIRAPIWLEQERPAIQSLRELTRLFELGDAMRAALKQDVPTPLDAPAFRARVAAMPPRLPELIRIDPSGLVAGAGEDERPARWLGEDALELFGFADADLALRKRVASILDAVERANEETRGGHAWRRAIEILRDAVRFPDPGPLPDHTAAQRAFEGLIASFEMGSWRGVSFWTGMFDRLAQRAMTEGGARLDAFIAVQDKTLERAGASEGALIRLIERWEARFSAGRRGGARDVVHHARSAARTEPEPASADRTSQSEPEERVRAAAPQIEALRMDSPAAADAPADPSRVRRSEPAEPATTSTTTQEIDPPPAAAPATAADVAPAGADADLELAIEAAGVWRRRYEDALEMRAAGHPHHAVSLDLSSAGGAPAAVAAIHRMLIEAPARAGAVLGSDLAWALTQLIRIETDVDGAKPIDRAPDSVRLGWSTLAMLDDGADIRHSPDLFFLFVVSKLGRVGDPGGTGPNALIAPYLRVLDDAKSTTRHPRMYANYLPDFLFRGGRKRETPAPMDLGPDDWADRLHRALLFLAIVATHRTLGRDAVSRLWEPIPLDPRAENAFAGDEERAEKLVDDRVKRLDMPNDVADALVSRLKVSTQPWISLREAVKALDHIVFSNGFVSHRRTQNLGMVARLVRKLTK